MRHATPSSAISRFLVGLARLGSSRNQAVFPHWVADAGEYGDDAVKASQRAVQPVRSALAFPFIGLLIISKLLGFVGRILLTQLSPRIARDVPEIPIGIYVLVGAVTLVISRWATLICPRLSLATQVLRLLVM